MSEEEKPFAPTAGESLMAVFAAIILIAFCVGAFLVRAKCYYETGKALSDENK